MPSVLLTDSITVELGGSEPWPQNVELYQPHEVEQILLPDNSVCLAVQTFLKMCGLSYKLQMASNAEHMSPSGRLPFLHCGAFVVAELDPIVAFINTKGITLTEHLDSSQKADMRAYISLVNNVLANAEHYLSWCDNVTYQEVTKPRYGSVYTWPISQILTHQKKKHVNKRLTATGWANKNIEEVYTEVENCCMALSERLSTQPYFFNNKPTELDALVFGHLFTILTTPLPDNRLATIVREHRNLLDLCQRIEHEYFEKTDNASM